MLNCYILKAVLNKNGVYERAKIPFYNFELKPTKLMDLPGGQKKAPTLKKKGFLKRR